MNIIVDTSSLSAAMKTRLQDVLDPQSIVFREVALDLVSMIHERIHVDGKSSTGGQIGTYTNQYMKVRTGEFGNADTFKKGKNVGKRKNAGTHTKGEKVGTQRAHYHRSGDTKVILSLTRQMENDYAVIGIEKGWGIGFNNEHNADKARWNDKRYGPAVFALTDSELEYAKSRTIELVKKHLEGK